jgi:hypothetical protein
VCVFTQRTSSRKRSLDWREFVGGYTQRLAVRYSDGVPSIGGLRAQAVSARRVQTVQPWCPCRCCGDWSLLSFVLAQPADVSPKARAARRIVSLIFIAFLSVLSCSGFNAGLSRLGRGASASWSGRNCFTCSAGFQLALSVRRSWQFTRDIHAALTASRTRLCRHSQIPTACPAKTAMTLSPSRSVKGDVTRNSAP